MNLLRKLRLDKELNQDYIAKVVIGCSQATYSRYESEEISIPIDILEKLALFYETSVDYIIGLTDEIKPYKRTNKNRNKTKNY